MRRRTGAILMWGVMDGPSIASTPPWLLSTRAQSIPASLPPPPPHRSPLVPLGHPFSASCRGRVEFWEGWCWESSCVGEGAAGTVTDVSSGPPNSSLVSPSQGHSLARTPIVGSYRIHALLRPSQGGWALLYLLLRLAKCLCPS